ncbi:hypothetical protein O7634_25350 [Micromonospora sp. WMMD1120]|uniref:hypothetical protein n=1 Tax=Micromonospora sp. WMMD1120 TaxID=3016106 RepID=UPI002416A407|nr:hypothetical protein [Micromonospora sp. WMMD1120]MDG4810093.1 hypothetical protein [Micromonospora sp. WMMD1120]
MPDKDEKPGRLRAGDVVLLTTAASVQFRTPIVVRVIREIPDRHTYDGWLWLDAYQLNSKGEAVARRELFVMRAGLRLRACGEARPPAPARRRATVRAV